MKKEIQKLVEQVEALAAEYKAGNISYPAYLKKHKSAVAKHKRLVNPSVADQVKEFGAKVIREKGYIGYYIYKGVNFTVGFNSAECESSWWEVNHWDDGVHPAIVEAFEDYNVYDTKSEVINQLLNLDKNMSERK